MHYIILLAFLVLWTESADARDIVIKNNPGGNIQEFSDNYRDIYERGDRIVIDGYCASACTMALSLPNTCVTKKARLGFHAARWVGTNKLSNLGTHYLMRSYPRKIQEWIRNRGGLRRNMIYLKGKELASLVNKC